MMKPNIIDHQKSANTQHHRTIVSTPTIVNDLENDKTNHQHHQGSMVFMCVDIHHD